MKKVVFLEGLPGIGKTTIINYIKSKNIKYVHTVDEIINPKIINTISHDQNDFIENDNLKYEKYNDGLIIIDRGFISTLSYNEVLEIIGDNKQLTIVKEWFEDIKHIYQDDNVITIYLTCYGKEYKTSDNDINGPYGSIETQKKLEYITIQNIKKYCKNYEIVVYNKKEMEKFVNEIIDKYLRS